MGITGNLGILFRKALCGIDQNQADIRPIYRHIGTQHAIVLDALCNLCLFPDSGGVNEGESALFVFHNGIRCITCCPCHIGNDNTFLSGDAVDQRGLAHVRLTDNGNLDVILVVILRILLRQVFIEGIQHIAGAVAMCRRNGIGIADSQIIELIEFHRRFTDFITFIDC